MNQNLLILADFAPSIKKNIQTIGIQEIDIEKLFNNSSKNKKKTYLFVHPDVDKIFQDLISGIKIIHAAGGLVKNAKGEYLLIYRLGKWDLPKGKVESGEKMKEAALREVEEECGVKIDYLGKKIATTYHTYQMKGKLVLKQTKWYEMGINNSPVLTPQLEEDISAAEWVRKKELKKIKENTYPLINDVLDII